mgnify:CR=1 FL=1|tara:strand:+ start:2096 stop:2383 length:288 start_codon:yes stop_codon:yes gene_type:complete
MSKIVGDRMKHLYEEIQDKTIVEDLKKEIYMHEVKYLDMIGVNIDDLENDMDSIVQNRVESNDMINQLVEIMSDRKRINSAVDKTKRKNSKNRWA